MKLRFIHLLIVLIIFIFFESCARQGRPEGGEKDVDPPIMIVAEPDHLTTNFNSEKIRINFDEYIKLKDVNQQLVISPPMDYDPEITPIGTASKSINIKILDTLKENTTYTFNFGNSIEDNNEGNILGSFKYVFSTGDYIDSLFVSGTVSDAYNSETDENISIQLYKVTEEFTDSIIYNGRPSYVANTLDSIVFDLTNLKAGEYMMIALNDFSNNYTFEPKQDKIGYHPSYITLPNDSTFHIKLFTEELPFKLTRPSEVKKGQIYFGYEGDPKGIDILLLSDKPDNYKSSIVFEKDMDSLSYWHTPTDVDSLLFQVSHNNFIDTVSVNLRSKERDTLLVNPIVKGTLSLRDTFAISTNIPFTKINKSQISIINKDSLPVKFTTYIDSSKKNLKLNFKKEYNNQYNFRFLPNSIEDLFGETNDTLNFSVSTKHPDDYGNINLTVQNIDSYPFILEILDGKEDIVQSVYSTEKSYFKFEHLDPKNYSFRVIYDINKNGKWDSGNFLKKTKPEKVIYFKGTVEIRANWEENQVFDIGIN